MFDEKCVLGASNDSAFAPATRERLTGLLDGCEGAAEASGALAEHNIVLFATHGRSDAANPWEKSFLSIASSGSGTQPGRLTLRDICRLDLSRVQCAVLSACETSMPEPTDSTGEQIAFPAAFLAAGASSAVGSLWEVEVGPTALMLHHVFEQLQGGDRVNPKSQTLRRAQRWLRTAGRDELNEAILRLNPNSELIPPDAESHPFGHPYYWAAFGWHGAI